MAERSENEPEPTAMQAALSAALAAKQQQSGGQAAAPGAPPTQSADDKHYDPDLSMEQTAVKNEVSKPRKGLQDRKN